MKTSGGRRQTPVHPFHAGKGFHDGTSDAEKYLRPPPLTPQGDLPADSHAENLSGHRPVCVSPIRKNRPCAP
jgi:hypothetical protein